LLIYCIAQSTSSDTSLIIIAVVYIDCGISIVLVANIVSLNFAKLFDKFTIFCNAFNIDVRNLESSIILTVCNFVVKLWNKLLSSSAAVANSLKPSIFTSNSIVLVWFAISAAAAKSSL